MHRYVTQANSICMGVPIWYESSLCTEMTQAISTWYESSLTQANFIWHESPLCTEMTQTNSIWHESSLCTEMRRKLSDA